MTPELDLQARRATWPAGPWDDEPNRIEWRDEATGLPCLMRRNMRFGNWCGYVAVLPGHPLHSVEYDKIDGDIEVHGGLTYSDACDGDPTEGICHTAPEGEQEPAWWFGFDCNHLYDRAPGMTPFYDSPDNRYRDAAYVRGEVTDLARQLAERSPT